MSKILPVPATAPLTSGQRHDSSITPRERAMIKFLVIASGLILAFAAVPAARAQVTLDISKITCDQYTGYKITNTQNIAIWLSGYYQGKRGDTKLETQGLVADAKKLRSYRFRNPETLVMNAVETLFAKER
jgi:hypothetical protein